MGGRSEAVRKGWATRRLTRVAELEPKLAKRVNQSGMAENALAIEAEIARLKELVSGAS